MITLFPSTHNVFTSTGLGNLDEAISCLVIEERNGSFELELEYSITGRRYADLALRRIIVAKPNPYSSPQPFRIYDISKPIDGIVTVNARHISYDLSGNQVSPFTANSVDTAFVNMKGASVIPCPFEFSTNVNATGDISIVKPVSMRSILGNEILKTYGGEYEFDTFAVNLHSARGQNRGVSIRYGKNLTDIRQDENCDSVYTGVYPYWYSEQDGLVELPEKVLNASGTYDFVRVYPLDLSQIWSEVPTETDIRNEANNFMTNTNIGIPKVAIDVSFAQLSLSEEYKNFAILETVKLCDYVTVEFPKLGVSATAKCIKTTYNVITDKYESLELGEVKSTLAITISDSFQTVEKKLAETNARLSTEVDTIKIGLADIDDAMIKKANIADLEVGYAHLSNGVIDVAQIGNASITNVKIANGAIDNAKLADASIDTANIIDGAIDNAKIADASIEEAHIINGSVTNVKIANGAIDNAKIANASIDTAKIQTGAITTALIGTGAVETAQIADGSITDAKIVELTANKITSGTIDAANIEVINLHAENITVGTINGQQISSGAITAEKLAAGAVTSEHIAEGAITAEQLAAGTITGDKLALGAISANNLNLTNHMLY